MWARIQCYGAGAGGVEIYLRRRSLSLQIRLQRNGSEAEKVCFVKNIVYKSTRNTIGLYVILHKLKNRIAIPPCPDCVGAARPAYPEVPGGSGQREAHPLTPLAVLYS